MSSAREARLLHRNRLKSARDAIQCRNDAIKCKNDALDAMAAELAVVRRALTARTAELAHAYTRMTKQTEDIEALRYEVDEQGADNDLLGQMLNAKETEASDLMARNEWLEEMLEMGNVNHKAPQ